MNIEAQRELLRQRGFSSQHPLVRGEIAIHPELVGHLHFGRPGQTSLPLHHDDFLRFLPEMQRTGMQTAFPDNSRHHRPRDKAVSRHKNKNEERSHSQDPRHNRDGWDRLNMLNDRVKTHQPFIKLQSNGSDAQHHPELPWYMRSESGPSLVMQSRTDSGIGEEIGHHRTSSPRQQQHLPSCNKSSFGMILKDKFQKNPNMYFPAPASSSLSPSSPAVIVNSKDEDEDWSDDDEFDGEDEAWMEHATSAPAVLRQNSVSGQIKQKPPAMSRLTCTHDALRCLLHSRAEAADLFPSRWWW